MAALRINTLLATLLPSKKQVVSLCHLQKTTKIIFSPLNMLSRKRCVNHGVGKRHTYFRNPRDSRCFSVHSPLMKYLGPTTAGSTPAGARKFSIHWHSHHVPNSRDGAMTEAGKAHQGLLAKKRLIWSRTCVAQG